MGCGEKGKEKRRGKKKTCHAEGFTSAEKRPAVVLRWMYTPEKKVVRPAQRQDLRPWATDQLADTGANRASRSPSALSAHAHSAHRGASGASRKKKRNKTCQPRHITLLRLRKVRLDALAPSPWGSRGRNPFLGFPRGHDAILAALQILVRVPGSRVVRRISK